MNTIPARRLKTVNSRLITKRLRAMVEMINEELGPVTVERIMDLRPPKERPMKEKHAYQRPHRSQ